MHTRFLKYTCPEINEHKNNGRKKRRPSTSHLHTAKYPYLYHSHRIISISRNRVCQCASMRYRMQCTTCWMYSKLFPIKAGTHKCQCFVFVFFCSVQIQTNDDNNKISKMVGLFFCCTLSCDANPLQRNQRWWMKENGNNSTLICT